MRLRLFLLILTALVLASCRAASESVTDNILAAPTALTPGFVWATSTPSPVPPTPFVYFPPIVTPTATPTPPGRTLPAAARGIWISAEELARLPMFGEAWEKLKETADAPLIEPNLAGYNSHDDVHTLAIALVYARTGDPLYRAKTAEAIRLAMGTEYTGRQRGADSAQGGLAVTVGRNLVDYVLAADLIGLGEYDPALDTVFRQWLARVWTVEWSDGSIIVNDDRRANNHGRMAGASRAAVAIYLGDQDELEQTARVFKGFLGDREMYASFNFNRDLSWQFNPEAPVGINPPGATKDGQVIDGALTEEMRRGCAFEFPPCPTNYPWEALQGILVEAAILHRQGYDVWNWEDQAILRSVQFLYNLHQAYPAGEWWATGDDRWIPWLVNAVYGTSFPTEPARRGKNMGWTDWTHAPRLSVTPAAPLEGTPTPGGTP